MKMKSKGHFLVSLVKSVIRISGSVVALAVTLQPTPLSEHPSITLLANQMNQTNVTSLTSLTSQTSVTSLGSSVATGLVILAVSIIVAEVLGIVEELIDKR